MKLILQLVLFLMPAVTVQASFQDSPYIEINRPSAMNELRFDVSQYLPGGVSFTALQVNYGDGSAISSAPTMIKTYSASGAYQITVTTWDSVSNQTVYTKSIRVGIGGGIIDLTGITPLSADPIVQDDYSFEPTYPENLYKLSLTRNFSTPNTATCQLALDINGVSLIKNADLNCSTTLIERFTRLPASTTVTIGDSVSDPSKGLYALNIQAVDLDFDPPEIYTNPSSNSYTMNPSLTIEVSDLASNTTTYVWDGSSNLITSSTLKTFGVSFTAGTNNFVVQSADSFGHLSNYQYISNITFDEDPATVSSDLPVNYYTNSLPKRIPITLTSSEQLSWIVIGGYVPLQTGVSTYLYYLDITTEGLQEFTVETTDRAGNYNTQTISFNAYLDDVPPVIATNTIPGVILGSSFTVSVSITDISSVTTEVYVDDQLQTTETIKNFDHEVGFSADGTKVLKLIATDEAGRTSEKSISIFRSTAPLAMTITSPASGSIILSNTIELRAKANKLLSTAKVNSTTVPINSDQTSISVNLINQANGVHSISVEMTDVSGTVVTKNINVEVQAQLPVWTYEECPVR